MEANYAEDDEHGRKYLTFDTGERFYFPQRIATPVVRNLPAADPAYVMASDETLNAIRSLHLPRYQMGKHLSAGYTPRTAADKKLLADLDQSSRGNLAGFTRITLFQTVVFFRPGVPGYLETASSPQPCGVARHRRKPASACGRGR